MNRSALITALVITQCILGQVGLASTFSTQRTSASKAQDSLLEQTYSNRFDVFYGLQEAYLKQMALKIIDQNGGQEPMQVRYQRPDRFDWRSFVIATLPGSNRRIWVSSTDKYIQEPDRVRRQVGREYLFSPMTIQDLFQRVDGMVTTEQPIPEDPSDEVRLYARIVFDHFVNQFKPVVTHSMPQHVINATVGATARWIFSTSSFEVCELSVKSFSARRSQLDHDRYFQVVCLGPLGTLSRPVWAGGIR